MFLSCHYTTLTVISLIFLPCYYLWAYGLKHLPSQFSYLIPSFDLYNPAFLLGQSISYLWLPQPIYIFGHLWSVSFFHSHGLLLNSLGYPGPITTSLPLGLLAFKPTPFTNSFLLGFPGPFLLSFHLLQFQ